MKRLTFVLLITLVLGAVPVLAQGPEVTIVGAEDNPDAVREMLLYAIAPGFPGGKITIYVAMLPEDLTYELTVPEGTRIVGSVHAYSETAGPKPIDYTQIYLASEQTVDEVMSAFSESLLSEGWWSLGTSGPKGFTDSAFGDMQLCSKEGDVYMNLQGIRDSGETARIFIHSSTEQAQFLCGNPEMGAAAPGGQEGSGVVPPRDAYSMLPNLITPEGVQILNFGSSGGGGGGPGMQSASTSVFVESELSAGEIVALYNEQLVAAGWTLVENLSIKGLAGSSWTFSDEGGNEWNGILSIQAVSGDENVYYAMILIVNQI